jgi:hypothetical protein
VACPLCGEQLTMTPRRRANPVAHESAQVPRREVDGRWLVLGVGLALAPVLTLTPLLRYVGWFLASLVHETGHTAVALLFGCPAYPAIRLDGHAVAIHRDQQPFLCALVVVGLLAFAWSSRGRPWRLALALGLLVAYPLAAFTGIREALFLLGGHLGELAFAAYAFSRALDGGFSGTLAERFAHSGVAWYLVARTGVLTVGLLTSDAARATYATNGSLGLENDLLRFSRSVLHTPSPAVAALLLLLAALVIVVVALVQASRHVEAEAA